MSVVPSRVLSANGIGWMRTQTRTAPRLDACARSEAATVELFPSSIADHGLSRYRDRRIATCEIGSTPIAEPTGQVTVRWLSPSSVAVQDDSVARGWIDHRVTPGPHGRRVAARSPGPVNNKSIGDYIPSWAAFDGFLGSATTTGGLPRPRAFRPRSRSERFRCAISPARRGRPTRTAPSG